MIDQIGCALHNIRERKGISMTDLARQIHVSRSLISQIEKGKSKPSLDTLEVICGALGCSLSDLFQMLEHDIVPEEIFREEEIIVRKNRRKVSQLPGSPNRFETLTPPGDGGLEFFVSVMAPYSSECTQYVFRHPGKEYVCVIKGQVELFLGKQRFLLDQGDSACFDSSIKHYYRNYKAEDAEMLCVATPIERYTNHMELGERVDY